jgi:nucleoid-associated protein YgaU
LALFALATRWQDHWTEELRSERDRTLARQGLPSDDRAPVLGRVIVGLQSGAPVFEARSSVPSSSGTSADRATAAEDTRAATSSDEHVVAHDAPASASAPTEKPSQPIARVFQLTVKRGDQLGELCRKHYGSARRELIDALARYNHMASADQLREGQQLLLPPIETLIGERR